MILIKFIIKCNASKILKLFEYQQYNKNVHKKICKIIFVHENKKLLTDKN